MLVSCFALWGLLNNMTDNLVPAFKNIFTIPQEQAALVQVAFYGAYAVLAIFASILIEVSYKKGVLIGLGVYIAGALAYIPACIHQSFEIYFVAIFVVAAGCSVLETTCNPYVISLGPENGGASPQLCPGIQSRGFHLRYSAGAAAYPQQPESCHGR